jgi:hypothetical protein
VDSAAEKKRVGISTRIPTGRRALIKASASRPIIPAGQALLVEGPADDIETVVAETQRAMREASELCLPGFPFRTDAKVVWYPDRYMDPRGEKMWNTVMAILGDLMPESRFAPAPGII